MKIGIRFVHDSGIAPMRVEKETLMEEGPKNWDWLDALLGKLDDDVVQAVNEDVPQQERPALDELFHQLGRNRERN